MHLSTESYRRISKTVEVRGAGSFHVSQKMGPICAPLPAPHVVVLFVKNIQKYSLFRHVEAKTTCNSEKCRDLKHIFTSKLFLDVTDALWYSSTNILF